MIKYSFIIPTYNRKSQLKNCIDSILNLDFDNTSFEIIVVNDGGVIPKIDFDNVTIFNQANAGPAKARNVGASKAIGEYLIFIDDDCCLDKNWLHEIALHCKQNVILTGCTINRISNLWSESSQQLLNYLYEAWLGTSWHFFASNNLVISKIDFMLLNGFNADFPLAAGEDREFCFRAKLANIDLIQIKSAIVFHYHNLGLLTFIKQHYNYGKGAFYFNQILENHSIVIPIQPFNFYLNMLKYPFLKFNILKSCTIMLMICISQVCNLIGFITKK